MVRSTPQRGATAILSHSLHGSLAATGGATVTFTFHWGDEDGETNASAWDNAITISDALPSNLFGEISGGLTPPTVYYARVSATNTVGADWSDKALVFTPVVIVLPPPPTRETDLVGWWHFDDDTANDSSGNGYHGVHSSASIYNTDTPFIVGKSANFNDNQYVSVSDGGSESTFDGGNAFSISQWVKGWPDGAWEPYVSKRGEGQGWQIRRHGGDAIGISFTLRGPGNDDWFVNKNINDNQWHHLVGAWGGGKRKIYVDGILIGSENRSGNVNPTGSLLVFGARDNSGIGSHSNIWLDDVRFYSTPLTDSDVVAIYNTGNGDQHIPPETLPSVITSSLSVTAASGMVFSHQLAATGSPTNFGLYNAPDWLSINTTTGELSGTPPAPATHTMIVSATNTIGSDIKELTISVSGYNTFDYSMDLNLTAGGGISNQIILLRLSEDDPALNAIGFRYEQLQPNGTDLRFLSQDGAELAYEILQWDPLGESTIRILVSSLSLGEKIVMRWGNSSAGAPAYSMSGTDWSGTLTFANFQGPPTPVLPTVIFGKVGIAMAHNLNYAGTAPLSYSTVGLPPGLSVDASTGLISGTPVTTGDTQVTVTVTGQNVAGVPRTDSRTYVVKISDSAAFPFKMPLTLSGYDGNSTLTDFPVLVELHPGLGNFAYSTFLSATGGDLRFFTADGEELPYEIENWNVIDRSRIWVKVPSISGRNISLTAAWGNPAATIAPSYLVDGSTWTNGFSGTWHFTDLVAGSFIDSSPNPNHAASKGATVATIGQIGSAARFNGSSSAEVNYADSLNSRRLLGQRMGQEDPARRRNQRLPWLRLPHQPQQQLLRRHRDSSRSHPARSGCRDTG